MIQRDRVLPNFADRDKSTLERVAEEEVYYGKESTEKAEVAAATI